MQDGTREMKCGECGRRWVALCYEDCATLECPDCGHMVSVGTTPASVDIHDPISLLEECLVNGNEGAENLYAWFVGEREHIVRAIRPGG